MPPPAFTLSVPADNRYRGLATDLVRAYFALTKRVSPEIDTFVASVTEAVDRLAVGPANVEVVVEETSAGVDVRLTSAGRQETLHASL